MPLSVVMLPPPPRPIRSQLIEAKLYDDLHSPALDQLVLAHLVDRGG